MQLLKKIAVRTVWGDQDEVMQRVLSDKTKAHPLMRVVGVANGTKEGESTYGAWKGLTGRFEATNLDTGEVFRSPVCFLPEFAIDLVTGQFGDDVKTVQFAIDVGAEYSDGAATKYEYTVTPLTDQPDDDLARLSFEASKAAPVKAIAGPAVKSEVKAKS